MSGSDKRDKPDTSRPDDQRPPAPPPDTSAPLLSEHTEEVIADVAAHLDASFEPLEPIRTDSIELAPPGAQECVPPLSAERTEEVIADVMADINRTYRAQRALLEAGGDAPAPAPSERAARIRAGGLHRYLAWLVDAPCFLDTAAIDSLFRAAVPIGARGATGEGASPALAWLASSGSAGPEQRLQAILRHYLTLGDGADSQPRLVLGGPVCDPDEQPLWLTRAEVALPRPIALLELPPGAPLALVAAGFASGRTLRPGELLGREAADALERAESGALTGLSLRLPLGRGLPALTLRLRGTWPPDEAARLLFERAAEHGLRVVGTLHAGLGISALALYEP